MDLLDRLLGHDAWTTRQLLLVVVLTWQALRGQSIIAPDGLTLAALAMLSGGTVLIAALLVGWGLRQTRA